MTVQPKPPLIIKINNNPTILCSSPVSTMSDIKPRGFNLGSATFGRFNNTPENDRELKIPSQTDINSKSEEDDQFFLTLFDENDENRKRGIKRKIDDAIIIRDDEPSKRIKRTGFYEKVKKSVINYMDNGILQELGKDLENPGRWSYGYNYKTKTPNPPMYIKPIDKGKEGLWIKAANILGFAANISYVQKSNSISIYLIVHL